MEIKTGELFIMENGWWKVTDQPYDINDPWYGITSQKTQAFVCISGDKLLKLIEQTQIFNIKAKKNSFFIKKT